MRALVVLALAALPGCFDYESFSAGRASDLSSAEDLSIADLTQPGDLGQGCAPPGNPDGGVLAVDFELGITAGSGFTQVGPMIFDTTRPHCGSRSMHVVVPAQMPDAGAQYTYSYLEETVLAPPATGSVFQRAFVYLPSGPLAPYTEFFFAGGIKLLRGQASGFLYVHDNYASADYFTTAVMPLDRWVCLEWEVQNRTRVQVWMDETLSGDIAVNSGVQPLSSLLSGIVGRRPPAAHDFWLDDLIISKQRIGCH